ncbi:5-oxoprolinase subunit PxpB [Pseudoxanthomonas sp. PXM02]|uniref:5-oxoprolinase subunit PxpB n=1 Tax=Pseudoxanthomonas sp. PXM02 TaxID=2769294 RepID=UPI0017846644|nr:5-oxoprolinase subunit PxpB [Pseudoxanthomonas sp. PXM02]MBD9479963.1 5-oxoprolinase subunit PxpB [Pseudoxanthomonas sp. PXM02]
MSAPRFEPLGDDAVLVHLGEGVDPAINARVHALTAALRNLDLPWLRDLVPAYASLAVFFDAAQLDDPARTVSDLVHRLLAGMTTTKESPGALLEVPVCYGGTHGEDLADAASTLGVDEATLIARHSAAIYTVAMIGFAPGFPYLLGLDPGLTLPRLATPRTRVPAGSVAIAGAQAGIYPRESPGGWRLLGRTPLMLFDPARARPSLLQPGDRVRFVPIGADDFTRLERTP